MIHILCEEDEAVEITISDSDGDIVAPSQGRISFEAAKRHLKLRNSNGEQHL